MIRWGPWSRRHTTAAINPTYWGRREGCCQLQGKMGEVWREKGVGSVRKKKRWGVEKIGKEKVTFWRRGDRWGRSADGERRDRRDGGVGGEGVDSQIRKGCNAGLWLPSILSSCALFSVFFFFCWLHTASSKEMNTKANRSHWFH